MMLGMTAITPINREWIHEFLLQPYLEGTERFNRAWQGVDIHSLNRTPFSLKERAISVLVGSALMIPLINTVIWVAWQTFGDPERLSDPFCPEIEEPPPPPPLTTRAASSQLRSSPAAPVEPEDTHRTLNYLETIKNREIQTHWGFNFFPDRIVTLEHSGEQVSTAFYNSRWELQKFHCQQNGNTFEIVLNDPTHLKTKTVSGGRTVEQGLVLEEPLLWIQQLHLGFKNFVLSSEPQLSFYTILPEDPIFWNVLTKKHPLAMKCIAKRGGEEEVPPFGRLLKVEVTSTWRWPYNFKAELWFDATGTVRKFIDSGIFSKKSGMFVQNSRSPGPRHP